MPAETFLKALFYGATLDSQIFPYPALSQDETERIGDLLPTLERYFAKHVDSARIDREAEIPREVLAGLGELGLFGLSIPKRYGGFGLSNFASARVLQEIAGLDASVAVTLGAHQSLAARAVVLFGTEEQKTSYLPKLAQGEAIASFALTEPAAGSDAAGIQTLAIPEKDGSGYRLRGRKIWTSNGSIADVFVIFARTSALSSGQRPRLTAFLVDRSAGVVTGPNEPKLGVRGNSTSEVILDDVWVPSHAVLGKAGRGFRVAMEVLNDGRLGLAAGCVGIGRRLYALSLAHVQNRRAFGRNIGEFPLIRGKIADMAAELFALESMVYWTCQQADLAERDREKSQRMAGEASHLDYSLESAICKVFGSEALWRIANESLQIAAGSGYMASFPYERLLRDARVNLIFEGTNEILRCFIALGGLQGPARDLSELGRAVRDPLAGLSVFSEFARRKAKLALGGPRLSKVHPALERERESFERCLDEFARNVGAAVRRHGKHLTEMQFVLARCADAVISLFAMAACLSRTTRRLHERGEEGARRELEMTRVFFHLASARWPASFESDDDDLRFSFAAKAYVDGAYPLEIF